MAAKSKLAIINAALIMMGAKKIDSVNVDKKAAILANTLYDTVADEMADVGEEWYFMEARAQLSERSDSPVFGHLEKHYDFPVKFVEMIAVCDQRGKDIEYEWERGMFIDSAQEQHPVIRTNATTVFIKYIADVTNPQFWPSWYIRLIILRLVQYLVTAVKGEGNFINLTVGRAWDTSWKIAKKANAKGRRTRTGSNFKNVDLGNKDVLNAPVNGIELGDDSRVIRIET